MVRKLVWTIAFFVFSSFVLPAEEMPSSSDTQSTVPELIAFHDVIYPIWHTAYPNKDFAMLRGTVGEINTGFEKIEKAQLPGILRDKAEAWSKGLEGFKSAVADYNRAAVGTDETALLAAAEALHSRFEMMVRIIRPVLKEIDAYHQVLYVVFHKYLPERKYDDIRAVSADMAAKAEAIVNAQLPKRREAKAVPFKAAAEKLLAETRALAQCSGGEEIARAVDRVHSAYQALEKVFD